MRTIYYMCVRARSKKCFHVQVCTQRLSTHLFKIGLRHFYALDELSDGLVLGHQILRDMVERARQIIVNAENLLGELFMRELHGRVVVGLNPFIAVDLFG